MPKYLDQDGLTTFKSKLDTTYAKKNDVYDKTAADGLLSAKANSSDVYTKAQVDSAIAGAGGLPTITIAVSQVISQNPLQIQLTNEQYTAMQGRSVIFDGSALNMPAVIANYNGEDTEEGVTYQSFVFSYNSIGVGFLVFNTILINPSTKVAEVRLGGTYPHRASDADSAILAEEAQQADSVTYLNYAPSSANTSGIKIVVLSSEPATKYDGYLYLIKSN